ncbi:MAG: CHRD domain-containing protein [Verrucomicrobiae bacterium]|nr:CHRD domain-containing protein [Verrucomicrobiae bacterium]
MPGLTSVLRTHNRRFPLDFSTGVPGRFDLAEFFGPIPGWDTSPPCGWELMVIDPGSTLPHWWEGVRFTGSFRAPAGLANQLRAQGGVVELRVPGNGTGARESVFLAPLVERPSFTPLHFVAELTGAGALPPNNSPFTAHASFTLTEACLRWELRWPVALGLTYAGIFGPTPPRKNAQRLVADLSTPLRMFFVVGDDGTKVVYQGAATLDPETIKRLKQGKLDVVLGTAAYPAGELRGPILPLPPDSQRDSRH